MKIKICDRDPISACSYYRSIGPLSKLKHMLPGIEIEYISAMAWYVIADTDILFVSRPVDTDFIKAIAMAKNFNVPVWIDYDDLLHEVPTYNPGYKDYNNPLLLKNIEKALTMADIVTVTTENIRDYYKKFNPNIQVIPNAHNDYNYPFLKIDKNLKTINWRGSPTHNKDIMSCIDEMANIRRKYLDWNWSFMGENISYVLDRIQPHIHVQPIEIEKYFKMLSNVNPAIQIVPLLDNIFNRAKSNIAWQEATFSGAATLAPDLPEFNRPGIVNYKDAQDFEHKLNVMIRDNDTRRENYLASYDYMRENLMLSQVNMKRLDIINGLI